MKRLQSLQDRTYSICGDLCYCPPEMLQGHGKLATIHRGFQLQPAAALCMLGNVMLSAWAVSARSDSTAYCKGFIDDLDAQDTHALLTTGA